jgi:hypothetical protein
MSKEVRYALNLERFLPSDCDYCAKPADRGYSSILALIRDPAPNAEHDASSMLQFCNWQCLAHWAAKVADRRVASKP